VPSAATTAPHLAPPSRPSIRRHRSNAEVHAVSLYLTCPSPKGSGERGSGERGSGRQASRQLPRAARSFLLRTVVSICIALLSVEALVSRRSLSRRALARAGGAVTRRGRRRSHLAGARVHLGLGHGKSFMEVSSGGLGSRKALR